MTKEQLVMSLVSKGMTPDEAYSVSYDFKEGLKLLNKIKLHDTLNELANSPLIPKIKKLIHDPRVDLNDREKAVLIMRFGLSTGKPLTLKATGEVIRRTRERVRQIEAKALEKMRCYGLYEANT